MKTSLRFLRGAYTDDVVTSLDEGLTWAFLVLFVIAVLAGSGCVAPTNGNADPGLIPAPVYT